MMWRNKKQSAAVPSGHQSAHDNEAMRLHHVPPKFRQRGAVSASVWPAVLSKSSALLVWAAVAACAVAWGLRVWGQGGGWAAAAPSSQAPAWEPTASLVALGLGQRAALSSASPVAAAPAPEVAARLQLSGVVATGDGGAALISVDGQPARVVRVGRAVADGWVLRSVQPREVLLVRRGERATLVLPAASTASTPAPRMAAPISTPAAPAADPSGNANAQVAR